VQKPLSAKHRPAAKVALFRALERVRPEFYRHLRARAAEFAGTKFMAGIELRLFLQHHGVDTPWVWALIGQAARELLSPTIPGEKAPDLVVRLVTEPLRLPPPPRPQLHESRASYCRRAAEYYDRVTARFPRVPPLKRAQFDKAAAMFVARVSGRPPEKVTSDEVSPSSRHQALHRFAELLELRPFALTGSGRPKGVKERTTRHRASR
jgi:hypothetical protein